MTGFEAPHIEYLTVSPILIVLGVAVIGVLIEAFAPRPSRYVAQVAVALVGLLAAFAVLGIVLVAIYILWMYQRTMTGPVREGVIGMPDLNVREISALAPLLVLILVLGFYPKPLLDVINPAVEHTMTQVDKTDPEPAVTEGEAHE